MTVFLVGGAVVSAFAMLGDLLRPKRFAGLFGAAPSVALATLGIAVYQRGAAYAALQTQAMTAGAIALAIYSLVVCHLLVRANSLAVTATLLSLGLLADRRLSQPAPVYERAPRLMAASWVCPVGLDCRKLTQPSVRFPTEKQIRTLAA
jgi:hypothetical protein